MRLNRAVYLNTLRWFFAAPARVLASALLMFFAYLVLGGAAKLDFNGLDAAGLLRLPSALAAGGNKVLVVLAWILGVGVVRREASSGALNLVLTRPLSRIGYLLSKWAALVTLNLCFLVFCYGVLVTRSGADSFNPDMGLLFAAQAIQLLALSAILVCFSASPFNLGELGLLLVTVVALLIVGHYATNLDSEVLRRTADFGFQALFPSVDVADYASGMLFNAGVAAAALALGAAVFAHREFGYSDSPA